MPSVFWRRVAPLLALTIALTAPLGADSRAFNLGVLRRDGVLIPFATYTGRGWRSDWPGVNSTDLPISLASIPKRWWGDPGPSAAWTAHLEDGTARPLRLEKPEHLQIFCNTHLGVQTDYTSAAPFDPRQPTIPKDALATTGEVSLDPITRISNFAPDARAMIQTITAEFNKAESEAARRFRNWQHPYSETERHAIPIELEAFYRDGTSTPSGTWTTTYVEAVRRFPARFMDRQCGLITFVSGWVLQREGHEPVIQLDAVVTYCDREGVSFIQPFGRLTIDREPYWVYQLSSWRDELYAVARVTPGDVEPVIAVAGGGCPKDAPKDRDAALVQAAGE
jgi:hypothetical protein